MKTRKTRTTTKPYWEMTTEELRETTKEFDEPFVVARSRPLPPKMRAAWERAKRKKPGRPRVGQGAKRVLVTIEGGLLKQADTAAKKRGVTRSQAISEGLKAWLKAG